MPFDSGKVDYNPNANSTATADINKIYDTVQSKYGAIDAIFKTDAELQKLLRKALGQSLDTAADDMDYDQFLAELSLTNWWKTQAGIVRQRGFYKRQYNELGGAGKDVSKTEYGLGLEKTILAIKAAAKAAGATLTDADINAIAQELYDTGMETNTNAIGNRINSFIKYNPTPTPGSDAAKGNASVWLNELKATARANGITDFNAAFGDVVDGWLKELADGENLETIKQRIRTKAKEGKSDVVGSILDAGNDLVDVLAIRRSLENIARNLDVTLDPATLDDLIKQVFDQNLDGDVNGQTKLVSQFLKVPTEGSGGIGGSPLTWRNQLRDVALANGIKNFDAAFGSQIEGWLKELANGANIETFNQKIRDMAKIGMPQQVVDMLGNGMNLDQIVAPYRSIMSEELEIPYEQIDFTDPALTAAFGDKAMNRFDFQRGLRKDDRWQYTKKARDSVFNSAYNVLRDFGFTG